MTMTQDDFEYIIEPFLPAAEGRDWRTFLKGLRGGVGRENEYRVISDYTAALCESLKRWNELLSASKPAAPAQSGEPVAYVYEHATYPADYTRFISFERTSHSADFVCRPVGYIDPQPSQPAKAGTIPDECAASGASCRYAPDGRRGEMQCRYCGKPQLSFVAEARAAFEAQFERTIGYKPERYASFNYERDHPQSLWKWWQWAWHARATLPQATATDDSPTTVYNPVYVREKFAEHQRMIDGLQGEIDHLLAERRDAAAQATATQPAQTQAE